MQSPNVTFTPEEIGILIAEHCDTEGPLLPILHAIQDACGCIPDAVRPLIRDALNITEAELHGVISFYHDFRKVPAGRHVLKICRAEACQSVGGDAVATTLLEKLGLDWHGTTANGSVTVEPVYCLGLCACGPAAMVNDRVVGRVDAAKLDTILAEAGA